MKNFDNKRNTINVSRYLFKMSNQTITHNLLIFIYILLSVFISAPVNCMESVNDSENCSTSPLNIHVSKEQVDVAGNIIRNCEGDLIVNKCEGTCLSSIQPSVAHHTGFLKKCNCCRESRMITRRIQLTKCYDPDGKKLSGEKGTMSVVMNEPEGCHCFKCIS